MSDVGLMDSVPAAGLQNDVIIDPVAGDDEADPNQAADVLCLSTPPIGGHPAAAAGNAPVQQNYTVHAASMDVDQVAAGYAGEALVQRLEFVADHAPGLRAEALTLLARYLKENTHQVAAYERVVAKLLSLEPAADAQGPAGGDQPDVIAEAPAADSPAALDRAWMENAGRQAAAKLERLETDLKHYRTNSIKESIRRGLDDLALHHLDTGNLAEALKAFTRARDYCTNHKHQVQMCLNVIRVCVYMRNWPIALGYVARAHNSIEVAAPSSGTGGAPATSRDLAYRASVLAKLRAVQGLADLAQLKYKQAAKAFLQAGVEALDWREVIGAREAATYGALCALAKFDRAELGSLLQQSAPFKQLVEAEPGLGAVVRQWAGSRYSEALSKLDELAPDLRLDVFLGPHVDALLASARARGMAQYVEPYSAVRLDRMADAFNTSVDVLKEDLARLILDGQIRARIDSHRDLLLTREEDARAQARSRAAAAVHSATAAATILSLRAALLKGKICVTGGATEQQQQPQPLQQSAHRRSADAGRGQSSERAAASSSSAKGLAHTIKSALGAAGSSGASAAATAKGRAPRAAASPPPPPTAAAAGQQDANVEMQSGSDAEEAEEVEDVGHAPHA